MRIKGSFVAGVGTLLALCGIVSLATGFHLAHLQVCANNMRMIAGAKGSYGLERKLSPGDGVVPGMISPFLKGRWEALRCPSGGQYEAGLFTGGGEIGDAQHAPGCSVHGSLAQLEPASRGFFAVPRPYFVLSIVCSVLASSVVLGYLVGRSTPRSQPAAGASTLSGM
jgi:hypothetical protein